MAHVNDVATYIILHAPQLNDHYTVPMSEVRLQLLVYYAQAWHLAWEHTPLFDAPIEAKINGPRVRELHEQCKGRFAITEDMIAGNAANLTPNERETIDTVLETYGNFTGQQCSDFAIFQKPWREAYGDVHANPLTRRTEPRIISQETMRQCYSDMLPAPRECKRTPKQ